MPAIAVAQGHAVFVERDDRGFEIEGVRQFPARCECIFIGSNRTCRSQARFQSIGRDGGAAVIFAIIAAADRVGEHLQIPVLCAPLIAIAMTAGVQTPLS